MATKSRTQALADILPRPTLTDWAVGLRFEGGNSDKEYRVAVTGSRTTFQWGMTGAGGQVKTVEHADAATATNEALKQWAAKEAKGYWPTTGVLALPTPTLPALSRDLVYGDHVVDAVSLAYLGAVEDLKSIKAGAWLWLCQAPPSDAPNRTALTLLRTALSKAHLLEDVSTVTHGTYFTVCVTAASAQVLAAVCPVALEVGRARDEMTSVVAQTASVLSQDFTAGGMASRVALSNAWEAARILID